MVIYNTYPLWLSAYNYVSKFYIGARAIAGSQFGRGVGNILLDNVKCQGSENSLLQCNKSPLHKGHDCDHSEDAGVFCNQGTGVFHRTR